MNSITCIKAKEVRKKLNKIIVGALIFWVIILAETWGTIHQIDIRSDNGFKFCRAGTDICPARDTIAVGDTVKWTNISTSSHTSTSDAGVAPSWDSGIIPSSGSFTLVFTQGGVFPYHCTPHVSLNQRDTVYVQFTCVAKPGDANGDNLILLSDIVSLINVTFKGQTAPNPACRGDANADGLIRLSDIVYLINFVFKSGPAPLKNKECCL